MGSYFMQTVPNSHAYCSLRNFIIMYEYHSHRTDELTPDYILTGLKNTLKNEYELQLISEPVNAEPIFTTIKGMIEFLEQPYFDLKYFIGIIENTLLNNIDLKSKNKMDREEVYDRIDTERLYQDLRWSPRREKNETPDESKPPAEWINYIEFHIGEAKREVYFLNDQEALAHVRKVAALAVRCLEIHGCPERIIPEDLFDVDK